MFLLFVCLLLNGLVTGQFPDDLTTDQGLIFPPDEPSPVLTFPVTPARTTTSTKTSTSRSTTPFTTSKPSMTTAAVSGEVTHSTDTGEHGGAIHPAKALELTLKACCGGSCVAFDNLMGMVGLQCCGETPMNAFEKICCNNQIHVRHVGAKYFDRCCADKPYAWDQVCCRGKVYDGVPQASCCGDVPYSIYDRTSICCGQKLHKIPPNTGSAVCCGDSMFDDRAGTHFCCGDKLYSRLTHNGCCHPYPIGPVEFPQNKLRVRSGPSARGHEQPAEGYNSTVQMCCDRVYDRHEFDFCCYVNDANAKQWTPPTPKPYNSKTHCCDGTNVFELNAKKPGCG